MNRPHIKRSIRLVEPGVQWRIFWGIVGGMLLVLIIAAALCMRLLTTIKALLVFVPASVLPTVLDAAVEDVAFTFLLLGVVTACGGYYAMIMGHRIAGPVYRIREDLKKMAETGEIFEIRTRTGDGLNSLRNTLNELLPKLGRRP